MRSVVLISFVCGLFVLCMGSGTVSGVCWRGLLSV